MYCMSQRMQQAKREFLDDLSNYIPLGSMTLPILDTDEPVPVSGWRENGSGEEATYGMEELRSVRFARTFTRKHQVQKGMLTMRVYILPCDVGRRFFSDNQEFNRRGFMPEFMENLDSSFKSWEGLNEGGCFVTQYSQTRPSNHDSLIYLFNTVQSPSPNPDQLSCQVGKEAVTSILKGIVRGLKTQLYPFQRRSAATMIMREVEPSRSLDPRVEPYVGPTGVRFFYDQASGVLLRDRRDYDEVCGGILAEVCILLKIISVLMYTDEILQSMGYGKTLICLAAILATKGHWPQIPPQYSLGLNPVRSKVGTLREMAAATIGRAQIPWRVYFDNIGEGTMKQNYLKILENNIGSYVIPPPANGRDQRSGVMSKPCRIVLCSTTLIIVPPNLIYQWTHEISLHLDQKALKVLVVDNLKTPLPSANEILSYDVILMVKNRFEKELKRVQEVDSSSRDKTLCQCPFENECICNENGRYCSPLTNLHFLRIIVDEGHGFVGSGRNEATLALDKLSIERKWIVSGTPTAGLLGVELDTAAREVSKQEEIGEWTSHEASLEAIRHQTALMQEYNDIKQLGRIVINFFRLMPWANSRGEDPASWQKYVMPSKNSGRKPRCLRSILESLVVRHGIDDIEQDIQLPPLYNRRVYLQPSWHDKLSINIFILNLIVNAVTSDRMDEDYMFHPANRSQLDKLVTKLRQSGFYWVGHTPQEVSQTLDICHSYQGKVSNGDRHCAPRDLVLLDQVADVGKKALSSVSWKAFAECHEMGIYVEDFPTAYCERWSLVPGHTENPLLIGATQLIEAQKRVDSNLFSPNPELALTPVKIFSKRRTQRDAEEVVETKQFSNNDEPSSALTPNRLGLNSKRRAMQAPKLRKKNTISHSGVIAEHASSQTSPKSVFSEGTNYPGQVQQSESASVPSTSQIREHPFPPDSPLAKTRVVGTASAKLSYLVDRVIALQCDEKILIFFHGDHIAYFIAQAFEILDVRYLIYTATLGLSRQSAYATTFNTTETFRVMLMDIKQAAHGLNMTSASRIFFVNPVWQPNVEAQAIKRAHRIGQKRPVYVESLVLEGTLEAQMLERRKQMSTEDHQRAKKGPMDDPVMGDIIRNAEVIPLVQSDRNTARCEMASLAAPQPLFGRIKT